MAFAFVRMFFIMPAAAFMRMPCAALAASMRFFFFVVAAAHNYLTFFKCSTSSSTSVSSLCCREFFMQTFKWFDMMFVQTPCSAPDIDDIWRSMSMHCSSPSIILCIPRTCPSIRLRRRRSCFFSLSLLQCDAFFFVFHNTIYLLQQNLTDSIYGKKLILGIGVDFYLDNHNL